MKHDPNDPGGEYYRESSKYCAEEGHIEPVVGRITQLTHTAPLKDRPFLHQREKPKTVTQHVHELLVQREIIGREVHHRPLFHDVRSALEWMEEALEEEADKLQYLMAAYLKLKEILSDDPEG